MSEKQPVVKKLSEILERQKNEFLSNKRILTFQEYLQLALGNPERYCRDAAFFVRDAFDYYGSYTIDKPWGQERRWRLFDAPFDNGRDQLIGQEAAQDAIYRLLSSFAHEGRVDRLIVLNGPNGSAKSTFVSVLMRALEDYSSREEGVLYTFNWVFPSRKIMSRIGFHKVSHDIADNESFARLLDEDVDARLRCDMHDHPLLLLPAKERNRLITEVSDQNGTKKSYLPQFLKVGGLCHKCKQVYESLVNAYQGDFARVLQHVQVERWYISRSYRRGAVTIGPQLSVDAGERQISADRSLSALPTTLQMTTLFEPHGELVDSSGGILEFSDFLKRPIDAFRYLLGTIESGEVSLVQSILRLNTVMLATTNDPHLEAFREHPEYASFRGRITVVNVPYIRDYLTEQKIYDSRVVPNIQRHVAPHATESVAKWAVLTRLKRPDPKNFDEKYREIVKEISAGDKAELYSTGKVQPSFKGQKSEEIRGIIGDIYKETEDNAHYEGRDGASPREVRAVLLASAQDVQSKCVSHRAVLNRLKDLCGRKAEHSFLQRKVQTGRYEGAIELLDVVNESFLDTFEDELRTATGFVREGRHTELFEKYIFHVRHWVKKEKVPNKVTGKDEDPDVSLMEKVENYLNLKSTKIDDFRKAIISAIAGWAIEHPGNSIDIIKIFPDHIATLKSGFFIEHRNNVANVGKNILALLNQDKITDAEDRVQAEKALEIFRSRFGYCDSCLIEALSDLIVARYQNLI